MLNRGIEPIHELEMIDGERSDLGVSRAIDRVRVIRNGFLETEQAIGMGPTPTLLE